MKKVDIAEQERIQLSVVYGKFVVESILLFLRMTDLRFVGFRLLCRDAERDHRDLYYRY
jgi:hypothetical protein